MHRRTWSMVTILVAMLVLFAAPLVYYGNSAAFEGSDDQGSNTILKVDPTYKVWFRPLFEPSSGEVESGLFALQSGLGGVVLGIAIGRLWARRRSSSPAAALSASPVRPDEATDVS